MERYDRDVLRVPLESLDAGLVLIVPDLDKSMGRERVKKYIKSCMQCTISILLLTLSQFDDTVSYQGLIIL